MTRLVGATPISDKIKTELIIKFAEPTSIEDDVGEWKFLAKEDLRSRDPSESAAEHYIRSLIVKSVRLTTIECHNLKSIDDTFASFGVYSRARVREKNI